MPRRKPFIAWGYALAAGSRALIAFATLWPAVLAARLIDRTGKGMRSAPRDALISDVTPPESRGRAFGFHRALDHSGAVVGPVLAIAAMQIFSLRGIFLLAVIPGAIAVAMIAFFLREEPRAPRVATEPADAPPPARFWRAMTAIGLFALANSSDAFLILQAHAAGVSQTMLPLLWAAHHVVKSLLSTPAGHLSDRITRQYLLVAGWLLYAVVYAIFPAAHSLPFFFALFVVYALPFALTEGAERAWIADLVTPESRGRSFGIYYLTNGLGVLAGTALFGALYQEISPVAAFGTGAALAVVAAVVALTGIRIARHPSTQIQEESNS
jgi:MFS family permease